MKLQNKETLKVFDVEIRPVFYKNIAKIKLKDIKTGAILAMYNTLAELNEEWEDYEEPKEFWYIDEWQCQIDSRHYEPNEDIAIFLEELGLKFETKEEAEKAVEKLKAWKRLRDKGFKVNSYDFDYLLYAHKDGTPVVKVICDFDCETKEDKKDLDLLFGGEE